MINNKKTFSEGNVTILTSWGPLGRPLGRLLALLDAILGRLGTLLDLSRGVLEASRQLENEHGTRPPTKQGAANFHAWGAFKSNLQP